MKITIKKLTWKILKIIWFIFGGLTLFFTLIFLIKAKTASGLGVIGIALLFAVGIYAIAIFIAITTLFLLIKWIIKKLRKRKNEQRKNPK